MKKILILLTTIILAINASGQFTKNYGLDHKQKLYLLNTGPQAGKEGRTFFPDRQKASGNIPVKSLLAIRQKYESDFTEYWDAEASEWITYGKGNYVYDENLNCTLNMISYWDDIHNHWLDFQKNEITYDASGNMTSFISYNWDNYAKLWNIFMNANFEYDAAGNCTLEYYYDLNETTNQWEIRRKYLYNYNMDNNRTSKVETWLDDDSGNWVFTDKEEYIYDANGNITLKYLFYWNDVSGLWVNNDNEEYIYDSAGNNIIISDFYFSGTDSTRIETQREENTYDINRNRIMQVQNNWGVKTKTENTFDNNYSFEELILPYPYSEDYFRHMWTKSLNYSYNSPEWVPQTRMTINFTEVNTSDLSSLEDKDLVLYPNPASQFVSFDADRPLTSATLTLFDMQGRKVMTGVVDNNVPVSIKHLDKGLYVYRISDDGADYRGKLIIE